jgi:hypothetical protein
MLEVLPIEVVALGDFLLDFILDLEDVLLDESLGGRLVLLPKYADVVSALESTLRQKGRKSN